MLVLGEVAVSYERGTPVIIVQGIHGIESMVAMLGSICTFFFFIITHQLRIE